MGPTVAIPDPIGSIIAATSATSFDLEREDLLVEGPDLAAEAFDGHCLGIHGYLLLVVGNDELLKDCLFVCRRVGDVVKVVVQAIHGGVRGRSIAFGIGWQLGGRVGTIGGFFTSTGNDMELTAFVGKEIMGFPFQP